MSTPTNITSRSVKDLVKKEREKFFEQLKVQGYEMVALPPNPIVKSCFGRFGAQKNKKLVIYTGLTALQMADSENINLRFDQLDIALRKVSRRNKQLIMVGNYSGGLTSLPYGAVMNGLKQMRMDFLIQVFADPGAQNFYLKELAKTLSQMSHKLTLVDLKDNFIEKLDNFVLGK